MLDLGDCIDGMSSGWAELGYHRNETSTNSSDVRTPFLDELACNHSPTPPRYPSAHGNACADVRALRWWWWGQNGSTCTRSARLRAAPSRAAAHPSMSTYRTSSLRHTTQTTPSAATRFISVHVRTYSVTHRPNFWLVRFGRQLVDSL